MASAAESAWGSIQETADQLGVSKQTIRRYISAGRIRAKRVGPRLVKVDLTSLDNLDEAITPTASDD